jgi:hypothetical protein
MAKRSLGEVFIRSMVRQVGRDAGKVVSNQAFGDAHSTPIRMVKSADTSLQYVGSRRRYRHELDRVINGDLPGSTQSAKKQLVALENAFESFLEDLSPLRNSTDILILRNWVEKSGDYIEDVLKISNKPEVQKLADDMNSTLVDVKRQAKEQVDALVPATGEELPAKKKEASIVLWSGVILIVLGVSLLVWHSGETTSVEFPFMVGCAGLLTMIIGALMLSGNASARNELIEKVQDIADMKTLLSHW